MKFVVACGGTGGHTFPGLAVAEELRKRGHEVVVWTSGREIESSVMARWQGPVFSTGARQFAAKNAIAILRSILRCRKEMKKERPHALLAMGSYSSLPPVLAARSCRVPVFLHEANTVPGKAVDFLSRFAKKVAISFEMTSAYLREVPTERTGLPIRADITSGKRFDFIPSAAFVVFVTGGSQGAHAVNELVSEALVRMQRELSAREEVKRPLYIIHQTGAADEGHIIGAYAGASIPARVHAFEHEMANAFASADLVIARAGASTCFELAACGKPAIFFPLPSAMRNHQHFNADAFVAAGAAQEGFQDKLSPQDLSTQLLRYYDHPELLAGMATAMKSLAVPNAASAVADFIFSNLN